MNAPRHEQLIYIHTYDDAATKTYTSREQFAMADILPSLRTQNLQCKAGSASPSPSSASPPATSSPARSPGESDLFTSELSGGNHALRGTALSNTFCSYLSRSPFGAGPNFCTPPIARRLSTTSSDSLMLLPPSPDTRDTESSSPTPCPE